MKLNLKYIAVACAITCMTGCDDKLEVFEVTGASAAPVAIAASAVQTEALPGEIKLKWTAPQEDFAYMKIKYNDPLQKKDVYKIVSKGTTELLIEGTRARFGDYSFFFQTFNAAHQGSAVTEVKAKSGVAPATLTEVKRTKVELTAEQLSSNQPEPTEGPIKDLLDGNTGTFFHTRWSSPQVDLPHYIQVSFNEEHEDFAIKYTTRNVGNKDGFPTVAELQISNDGENWETLSTLSGLPTTSVTDYTSAFVMPGKKFKYFRFNVTAASQNSKYFHMSEFSFYDVDVEVYDPETVPLD
ncbi:discoidin domain-containing protein [Bacteroides timonensis]|uniref:discoidin domain-containing protein n=1 Tax=Bacteroides timonensis TaxID=1470345 RepID=UPI0005C640B0|nr:discoidin domain-containing protein [Bacteroides timonensis]